MKRAKKALAQVPFTAFHRPFTAFHCPFCCLPCHCPFHWPSTVLSLSFHSAFCRGVRTAREEGGGAEGSKEGEGGKALCTEGEGGEGEKGGKRKEGSKSSEGGGRDRRRDCHFADIPSSSLLKHLIKGEEGASECQNSRQRPGDRGEGCGRGPMGRRRDGGASRLSSATKETRLYVDERVDQSL